MGLPSTTPLIPKKLFFAGQDTPTATPFSPGDVRTSASPEVSQQPADRPSTSAGALSHGRSPSLPPQDSASKGSTQRDASRAPSRSPGPVQPVRYGLYNDPEEYYTRFVQNSNVRRYGLLALSDDSDSDTETEGGGATRGVETTTPYSLGSGRKGSRPIAEISPVENMLQQLQLHWRTTAELRSVERAARLQDAFQQADQELAGQLERIASDIQRKQIEQKRADEQQAQQQLQARTHKLQELQRSHEKAAAQQQQQVERLQRAAEAEEAARRKKQEEEEREAARRRAEEEARRQEEARVARAKEEADAAERAKQEEATRKQAEAAKAAQAVAATVAGVKPGSKVAQDAQHCIRCAPEARAFELEVAQRAKQIIDSLQPLMSDESLKKQRRDIEKKMTVHVQQISAVMNQVAKKCNEVYQLIMSQQPGLWRHYATFMFATKVLKQQDLVTLNNRAAFPLAVVVTKVSGEVPELMDLVLHMLHRECCFAVPCSFARTDPASKTELTPIQHKRLLGYKEIEDPNKPGGKMYESDDAFIQRVEGIMFLYGAIVQARVQDQGRNPHGIEYAWRWLSRFLNAIPASRASGKALIFFLRAAGYAMHLRYRGQFVKLLRCMKDEYLPELDRSEDHDVQAVRTMLEHYLVHGAYQQEPEGRSMPQIDLSSLERA